MLQLIKMTEKENNNTKLLYFNKNNLNTCYYSKGDKHTTCTHPHYCIFNHYRNELESQITQLKNNLKKYNNILKSIKNDTIPTNYDYEEVKKMIKNIENDLKKSIEFKKNILEKEVTNYGYE